MLIGQTAEKIEVCAHKHGFMDTVRCETFEEAIRYCYDHAVSGDAVLLSPACASWGMFPNYEDVDGYSKENRSWIRGVVSRAETETWGKENNIF